MRQLDRQPRTCCGCSRTYDDDELRGPRAIGWTPLRRGWRCPDCARAHRARVEGMARSLVAGHTRYLWVATQEHPEYDECLWCDVLRRASDLILERQPEATGAGDQSA